MMKGGLTLATCPAYVLRSWRSASGTLMPEIYKVFLNIAQWFCFSLPSTCKLSLLSSCIQSLLVKRIDFVVSKFSISQQIIPFFIRQICMQSAILLPNNLLPDAKFFRWNLSFEQVNTVLVAVKTDKRVTFSYDTGKLDCPTLAGIYPKKYSIPPTVPSIMLSPICEWPKAFKHETGR